MDNYVYFFISYQSTTKEIPSEIEFVLPENKDHRPECIHYDENYDKKTYYYKKVLKVNKSAAKGKKASNFHFEYEIGDYKYFISFDNKGNSFVYDPTLEIEKRRIEIRRKINQNQVEYSEKLDYFETALKKNGEKDKVNELYNQTINVYSKKKGFSLLISLFLKIYKDKKLCTKLMETFRKMNENPKDIEKNKDRKANLKDYTSIFKEIKSEADKLIDANNYSTIDFYGIILCYLHYYDYENFSIILKELSTKKTEPVDLYEILLVYNAHFFKYPINLNFDFFNGFIKYAILNKDFSLFQNGLNYIEDLETFINIIEGNKEHFYSQYIKTNDGKKTVNNIIKLNKYLIL